MKSRIFEKTGIFTQPQSILFDDDGIWTRFGCSEDAIAKGYEIKHFSDEMALRYYYEYTFLKTPDQPRILIIDDAQMYLPVDIARKFYVLRLSYETVFPSLSGKALRSMSGVDFNHLAFCMSRMMLPTMGEAETKALCMDGLYHGECAISYGAFLLNEAVSGARNANTHRDWDAVAHNYGKAAMIQHSGISIPDWDICRAEIEKAFSVWIEHKYAMLSGSVDRKRPILLSRVADYIRRAADKVALIVMDGMSIENFYTIQHVLADRGLIFEAQSSFSLFPTVTSVARQCIFSGKLPQEHEKPFSLDNEEKQWKAFWKNAGRNDSEILFSKGIPEDIPYSTKAVGIIINICDDLMHAELQGMHGMQQGLRNWARNGQLEALLKKLLAAGFAVFMTSDHGNTAAIAQGRFQKPGVLAEPASRRAIIYDAQFDARELEKFTVLRYAGAYLPDGYNVYLFEPDTCYGDKGKEYITHGGMTIEEAVVPFVRIGEYNG